MADNYETWGGNTMDMGMSDSWHNAGADPMFNDPAGYTDWSAAGGVAVSLIPALTTLIGVSAQQADIEARSDATIRQIANETDVFKFRMNVQEQQLKDLERATGDKMTASGLENLKRESRLKAVGAETGSTTVSDELISASDVNTLHEDAAILRISEVNKGSMMQQMVGEQLGFENTLDTLVEGMQSPLSAGLQMASTGMSSFNTGLAYLNLTQKESFFNTETKGA